MTRLLFTTAFLLGAAAISWMALGFVDSNLLALTVTAVIGGVYLIGIVELFRFRRATATLVTALHTIPARTGDAREWLGQWLNRLAPALRNAVRERIEGERVGLPAPVFTPYLVGLLVMLGLLGTFIGMVNTLDGAVLALQGDTELDTIRAGLAAPIQGLGVAFGTSVAGVAASAMLGLISTLVRRDRMLATRELDGRLNTVFRDLSLAHQRQQAFDALQLQSRALPTVADQLQAVAAQLASMGERLAETLAANQRQFHDTTQTQITRLAESVDTSLRETLAASGRAAGEAITPVMSDAMSAISRQLQDTSEQLTSAAREQLQAYGTEFGTATSSLLRSLDDTASTWAQENRVLQDTVRQTMTDSARAFADSARDSSAAMLGEIRGLLASTEELVRARTATEEAWLDRHGERMQGLTAAIREQLEALCGQQAQAQLAAMDRLAGLEATVADQLGKLGAGLEAPMTRLIETASETPRAAAEVIAQLRTEIANTIERDNQLLQERQQVMAQLRALSQEMEQAASGQRETVAQLVSAAANALEDISSRFGKHLQQEAETLSAASARVAGSATELSSLGEAFGAAVELFSSSSDAMIEQLSRMEESLERNSHRSDEQMAYYVAQAREIIDQSMLSQKDIIDDLHQLGTGGRQRRRQQPGTELAASEAG